MSIDTTSLNTTNIIIKHGLCRDEARPKHFGRKGEGAKIESLTISGPGGYGTHRLKYVDKLSLKFTVITHVTRTATCKTCSLTSNGKSSAKYRKTT